MVIKLLFNWNRLQIKLVDNGSTDDYGTIQFDLVGSSTLNISPDSLPYDGEFYSVMLTRMSQSVGNGGTHGVGVQWTTHE